MASTAKTGITVTTWILAIIELLIIITIIVVAIILIVKLVKQGETSKERPRTGYTEGRSTPTPIAGAASFDTKRSDTSSGFVSTFKHDNSTHSAFLPPDDTEL